MTRHSTVRPSDTNETIQCTFDAHLETGGAVDRGCPYGNADE
ncbi:hypothetical protein AB7C87_23755 [Natrarchaeobius sp. A-rgal3]